MSNFRAVMTLGVVVLAATSTAKAGAPAEGVVACTQIKTPAQLAHINTNATTLAGTYCLMNDIDLGSIANWTPIGGAVPYFSGKFYGNGHVVKNLSIASSVAGYYGLFGVVVGGSIRDLGVINANVKLTTGGNAGALLGIATALAGPIVLMNVHSTGQVRCTASGCNAGGLMG